VGSAGSTSVGHRYTSAPYAFRRSHADEFVALDRRRHCEPDTRVAGCRLHDRVTWIEPTVLLCPLDHAESYSILDGTAGVGRLHLGNEVRLRMDSGETNERCVADRLDDRFVDIHWTEGRPGTAFRLPPTAYRKQVFQVLVGSEKRKAEGGRPKAPNLVARHR